MALEFNMPPKSLYDGLIMLHIEIFVGMNRYTPLSKDWNNSSACLKRAARLAIDEATK